MAKKPWNMEKMENERDVSTFGETDEKNIYHAEENKTYGPEVQKRCDCCHTQNKAAAERPITWQPPLLLTHQKKNQQKNAPTQNSRLYTLNAPFIAE